MGLQAYPKYSSPRLSMLNIDKPGVGGLNIHDLEYELDNTQSPNMLNMMYANGTFGKRYGQEVYKTFTDRIWATGRYNGIQMVQSGSSVYANDGVVISGITDQRAGIFFNFNNLCYFMLPPTENSDGKFYQYNGVSATEVVPKTPTIAINTKPNLSYYDTVEDYNMISQKFKVTYHGDGTTKAYKLLRSIKNIVQVKVNNSATTAYTLSGTTLTFTTAPSQGTNNVEIICNMPDTEFHTYANKIFNNKYWCNFGGNNKSRIFLAGNGEAKYYYSDVFDATYFPETNYGILGNSEEDITGLAIQYNVMIAFKPNEMYSFSYYVQSSSTTTDESEYGVGAFTTAIVNDQVGCDCPGSIQLINNQLTWCNTKKGVMHLVSTSILDERNVIPISRNIEGGIRIDGLLQEDNLHLCQSAEWDKKYILSVNGNVYMWDYYMSNQHKQVNIKYDARNLCWFKFDNWFADEYIPIEDNLYYVKNKQIIRVNRQIYNDFGSAINAYYQTPSFQFNAPQYLKTVKNLYVQTRGDEATTINIEYVTEDSPGGEVDPEPIYINNGNGWDGFNWDAFAWSLTYFGNTHRRKCQLKKIQMCSIIFSNNELNRDMSISHMALEYSIVKEIK